MLESLEPQIQSDVRLFSPSLEKQVKNQTNAFSTKADSVSGFQGKFD